MALGANDALCADMISSLTARQEVVQESLWAERGEALRVTYNQTIAPGFPAEKVRPSMLELLNTIKQEGYLDKTRTPMMSSESRTVFQDLADAAGTFLKSR